ncbi:glycosyltransferase [Aminobacter carboxidus]|uniref:Glycosyltransferase n=1 Tax=Aminobacter carboxidus TaxID=376165 RepID=A0A8E1WJA3_9HYPH|nr:MULTISPECIES: glycosyltransferase [Aminobacter carboxidus group]MBB6468929.1 glycosyltransferase involved in cell wall biosynthesis/predicted O-methyltransferase YrrM [Aminobacter lissarensis]MBE1205508.1 glycosyltransferase [Aminobacter carboxidus]
MNYFDGKAFSRDWTSHHVPVWERLLRERSHEPLRVLEVGSFEGRSALFFLQFLPNCQLTCIDTFEGSIEHRTAGECHHTDMADVEARFDANTQPFAHRLEKVKAFSIEALAEMQRASRRFDIVYVDGDHHAASAFTDAQQSWDLLVSGGIMILDDYQWQPTKPAPERPKAGIDAFLQARSGEYEVLHQDYQVVIRKTRASSRPAASDFSIGERSLAGLSGGALKPPLVSFVVIAWNYARYVGATIDSIKAQDYPNFECLVIDNGSTDDSPEVIARHIAGDSRFTVANLPDNLGQLGAAFWSLDRIKGGFVSFVDADDVLLSTYASMHVQAHLALRQSVAFTSSSVAEMDARGNMLAAASGSGAINSQGQTRNLHPEASILRLPTVSHRDFQQLSVRTALVSKSASGWHWSPGTANMYRASQLRLVRRGGEAKYMRSADGYFNFMCHAFGGSALIDVVLSGYRLHGENAFSNHESSPWLRSGTPEYYRLAQEATLTDIDFLLANAVRYVWMLDGGFWSVLDLITRETPRRLRRFYSDPKVFEIFLANAPKLAPQFRSRVFCREILARYSGSQARKILRAGFGGKLKPRAYGEIALSETRKAASILRKRK